MPSCAILSILLHLSTLENEYGFRHEDANNGNGNMIFISDEKTGTERLLAIDLESYT